MTGTQWGTLKIEERGLLLIYLRYFLLKLITSELIFIVCLAVSPAVITAPGNAIGSY